MRKHLIFQGKRDCPGEIKEATLAGLPEPDCFNTNPVLLLTDYVNFERLHHFKNQFSQLGMKIFIVQILRVFVINITKGGS